MAMFINTLYFFSPNCCMLSFVAICSTVSPEKKIFNVFFSIFGHSGYLVRVIWIIYKHVGTPFIQMFPIQFVFDW